MNLEDAWALIEELRTQNAALAERIKELEQTIRDLEALKTPPPAWAKGNRPKTEKPAGGGGSSGRPNTITDGGGVGRRGSLCMPMSDVRTVRTP